MRVDAEVERGRIEMTAGRQGEDTASEVAAESTDGGATIEAAAENERVDFAIERDITVEEARRGIIGATTASVTDNR